MVGHDSNSNKLGHSEIVFAGAASGFITRAICQPLDVLKIRFQLQIEPISKLSVSKYRSIFQALYTITHEEGPKALWKGHVPAQFLSVSYGIVQFWCYETVRKQFGATVFNAVPDFYSGAVAGSVATLVSFPFDVVRTRLVAQSENYKVYRSVSQTFHSLITTEGVSALYKGLLPTIIQVAPHAGVQFMSYKFFESVYCRMFNCSLENRSGVFTSSVISGSLAGFCAKTAVYPFDLCRKRLQVQGFDRKVFGENFVCNGLVDCFRKTYAFEGIRGIYKGLLPSLIKAVVTTALHFTSYEIICYEIVKYRDL